MALIVVLENSVAATNSAEQLQQQKIVSLDFKKISIRELLQFIAEATNNNIIMSENVAGYVSLHFRKVTWSEALDAILEMAGLVKKQKDNILFIATANEFALRQKSLLEASPMKVVKVKLHHLDVSQMETLLKNQADLFSSNAKISINPQENSLWIKENLDNMPHLLSYLQQIDKPEQQILIAAKIINLDSKKIRELGLSFRDPATVRSSNNLSVSMPQQEANGLQLAIATIAQNQLLNLQLDALEAAGYSKVIADPKLITQNRKEALIEAGEEIPYQESTASGATSVTFKKAALSLKVKPTFLPDGRIILALEVSQNKVSPLAVNGTPAIQTQELKTEVIVHTGQTVILGGILEKSTARFENKLPFIANIPIVGTLLSRSEKQEDLKQLLIFVSPRVLGGHVCRGGVPEGLRGLP